MENNSPQLLEPSALDDISTYSYFVTFFRASHRYIESIEDTEKKQQTIMSFAKQFYDYMLGTIVNSFYDHFTIVENGSLLLPSKYREGIKVTIPDDMLSAIRSVHASVELVTPIIESLWSSDDNIDGDTYTRIHENIIRLDAFVDLINPE
jgi:hypothetical protein